MGVRAGLVLVLTAAVVPACLRATTHVCDRDEECGGGRCEPVGFCSFDDPGCPEGHRFGDGAGELSGACVAPDDAPDAGTDASIDGVGPQGDRDNDGVIDGFDNCLQLANPDQHDEDSDEVGDVCDNCPHLANRDQRDLLEDALGEMPDGVGDDCDPRPTDGRNRLLFFDPFTSGTGADPWDSTGGTWQLGGDEAVFTSTEQTGTLYRSLSQIPARAVVIAGVRFEAVGSASGNGFVGGGVVGRLRPADGAGYGCLVSRGVIGDLTIRLNETPNNTALAQAALSNTVLLNRDFLVTFALDGANLMSGLNCGVTENGTFTNATGSDATSTGVAFGLHVVRARARFAYVLVISD